MTLQITDLDREQILDAAMNFVKEMAEGHLEDIHGQKSIDWVLGYQACAKNMIDVCRVSRSLSEAPQ